MKWQTQNKILYAIIGTVLIAWLLFGFFGVQALFVNRTVNEQTPVVKVIDAGVTTITPIKAEGKFVKGDSTYTISGNVLVVDSTVSLTDFDVTNGPDLFVYLVSASSTDNQTVKDAVASGAFVNLGELKGNRGNQNYVLPSGVEFNDQSVISIWCRRFSRNFGSALLETH